MPCYDSRDSPDYVRAEEKAKQQVYIDKLTRMLCKLCKAYGSHDKDMPNDVFKWWQQHKKVDEERKESGR